MIAIINASPLIYLGKTGAISLLGKLFKECYTSEDVKIEVLRDIYAPEYPVLKDFFLSKIILKAPENQDLVRRLVELNLHYGEASIIVLAKELQENYGKKCSYY
jgi:predicted nucleic acid-binding protein